jgi:divalent metal cation (Fe/Co/Zn/Cd) transporter
MKDKKSTFTIVVIFFILGASAIYSSVDSIIDYYNTGKITFQMKPTLPRFYGEEALMMQVANIFIGLVFIIASITYYRKKFVKEHNKYEETNNLP